MLKSKVLFWFTFLYICSMKISQFIKLIAKVNGYSLVALGEKIGKGRSISFWRSVTGETIKIKDFIKVLEATGEPLTIIYKGEKIIIKN